MKYGLFSDIHSNLEAFQTVLGALEKEKVDCYAFIGDIVGYGASPKECIALLRDLTRKTKCVCVSGNHDYAVCGRSGTERYVRYAKEAIEWTKTKLDQEDIDFLNQMKLIERIDNFTIVHANLEAPEEWGYVFDIDDAFPNFKLLHDQVCFIGHSHKSITFVADGTVDWFVEEKTILYKESKYIINIGSVGQPRDGNPQSSYAVYDSDKGIVEIKRVGYDIAQAQKRIIEGGLPRILAERLSLGK